MSSRKSDWKLYVAAGNAGATQLVSAALSVPHLWVHKVVLYAHDSNASSLYFSPDGVLIGAGYPYLTAGGSWSLEATQGTCFDFAEWSINGQAGDNVIILAQLCVDASE